MPVHRVAVGDYDDASTVLADAVRKIEAAGEAVIQVQPTANAWLVITQGAKRQTRTKRAPEIR